MKYSKERAMAQIAATSLKSKKLPVGTELTIDTITTDNFIQNKGQDNEKLVPNDTLVCTSKDGIIRVPVREFMKMKTAEGKALYSTEEGSKDAELAGSFKITASIDRVDRNDNVIYPTFAYNRADDFFAGKIQWDALVDGGVKGGQKFDAVQNYTVAEL